MLQVTHVVRQYAYSIIVVSLLFPPPLPSFPVVTLPLVSSFRLFLSPYLPLASHVIDCSVVIDVDDIRYVLIPIPPLSLPCLTLLYAMTRSC